AGWTNQNRGKENAEEFIKKSFPSLMEYLKQYEEKAKKRDDQGDYWWELRKCAYYPEFEKEKIIYIEIMTDNWEEGYEFPCYTYRNDTCFVLNTAYIMTGKNLKYILGLLNSKFGSYLVKQHVTQLQKRQFRMLAQYVNNFEISPITSGNEGLVKRIEELVDKILAAKKDNPQADTKNFEEEIDKLVYKLYNLTEEEIRIIEGGEITPCYSVEREKKYSTTETQRNIEKQKG
ncbi:MAG: TaqI-like C-terminal specificity domain-containing protein, partial [Candidatus Hydrogenedens sp.]